MMKRLTVDEVAKILGKRPQFVRLLLQQDKVDWGCAVKMGIKWSYHISPHKFQEYIGEVGGNDKNNDSIQ